MPHQFITNQNKLLSEVFNKILPSSKELYFTSNYLKLSVKDQSKTVLINNFILYK